ncbi:transaldolase [Campylobacter sp. RM9344]|uniref:Transaldolase n=1 Tax=Campylobacter californiensis TaxID=1032243 RepID=A0AAW3ZXT2_9BACT|nr:MULTISPECIES: transaldolase [unclassified Campylobacter]MBE2984147.1 transaldolase [Campylobacter sp. RM6883]MBE2995517.1 transaldolase [Campylobacter sp. RM6913]MBE3029814.1 transaldolase [Campylobacter sp. RM9344]MBE3607800.1 transaldolase [Campylobacter sp. RM9337]QCD51408.1 transaldolase [Campylobacter sp. RM6914]
MYDNNVKFSLWCDFIEREFLDNEFLELLNKEIINGATSNPAIFKSAFSSSQAYKESILKSDKRHPKSIYETLATQDIKMAACKMLKNYVNDDDGFVSIEVDPNLSDDTNATIEEGVRLHASIGMPNVMIKVPATKEGFTAMSALMAKGISVNATLIFSPEQAQNCLDAFEAGAEIYKRRFPNTPLPKGVISIFVSRFDRLLDEKMAQKSLPKGQIGIMNAAKIYHIIQDRNLPNVRALFASTGVKGGELRADYYVRELMYENSINTAPLDTIKEFIKEKATPKKAPSKESIESFFEVVNNADIDMNFAYKELLNDGLKAFVVAFENIMKTLK